MDERAETVGAGNAGAAPETGLWAKRAMAAENAVIALLMATTMTIGLAGVVMRYAFNDPLTWPDEFNRYLLVVLTYLGAYINVRRNDNIRATSNLTNLLGPRLRHLAAALLELATAAFCAYFAFLSASVILKLLHKTLVSLPTVPVAAFNLFVPVFLVAMALVSLWRGVLLLRAAGTAGGGRE
ncbi:MAG: TRAP transporter small permease subunit [Rhodospirillales bacterium]|jgi:TRAP-type C4-dicarboxylate transport system permease small subunit|nr:TRAP transporter small permease subunit [Rhodospirillales bacterium]